MAGNIGPFIVHNCENRTQALARCVIAEHMRGLRAHIPQAQIVMMSHDEIVSVVPKRSADKALRLTQQIMSAPPDWAKGLPLAVDAHISEVYDKK